MKKIVYFLAMAAALCACSKNEKNVGTERQTKVSFQVARFTTSTKANEDYKNKYQNVPFGTYAWYKGQTAADDKDFMVNQDVAYTGVTTNTWEPVGVIYYWPKSGSIDFVSYSPFNGARGTANSNPVVAENKISYAVSTIGTEDLMYSDKVNCDANKSEYYYNGVPTLFHHALAKVNFLIKQTYTDNGLDPTDPNYTQWVVTVSAIDVNNLNNAGTLDLNLNASGNWDLPTYTDGDGNVVNIWTAGTGTENKSLDTTPGADNSFLVLPQSLVDGNQNVTVTMTIDTYRGPGGSSDPSNLVLHESNVQVSTDLGNGNLPAWEINKDITYTFQITPSLGQQIGVDPITGDPIYGPVKITFDPAIADWDTVDGNVGA